MFQCLRRIKKKTNFMIFKKDPGHFIWNGFLLLFMKWRVHPTCCRVVVVSYFFFPGRERNSHDDTLDYNYAWHATGRVIFPFFSSLFFPTCFFLYSTLIFLSFCLLWLRWGKTNANPSWHLCQTKTTMRKVSRTVKFRSTKLNKIILCRIYLQKNCLAPVKLII